MELKNRISVLSILGEQLSKPDPKREAVIQRTYIHNNWFTVKNINQALSSIADHFLQKVLLENWLLNYQIAENTLPKKIGLILAGNIPLVGFHDVLCVFLSGHHSKIKLSEKDQFLIPFIINQLIDINPKTAPYFETVERLANFDAVIATGSNNSARYFEAYFGKYPHIIRKNRNAVAVLNGKETTEDFLNLGNDIFQYFGLGCRNVSKLYVPQGYTFDSLLEVLHEFREIVQHHKYKNNFDYNFTLLILNQVPHLSNGCILLNEDKAMASRIAQLHYEYYDHTKDLEEELIARNQEIQCVVGNVKFDNIKTIPFGKAQEPALCDYADGIDTMEFLLKLNND